MISYRVYMSVRHADTGEQLADVTIMRHVDGPQLAEMYVEGFNSDAQRPAYINDITDSIRTLWQGTALLVVYMKEAYK